MNREEAVFAGAIDCCSPDEVSAYLTKQCGGDQQLRGRVERLLAAHAGADSLLDPPLNVAAATRDVQPTISERPGDQIGHYKLLQEIGSGGFGVVYMAEQIEPVRRRVALKIIKPGMDTREVIARFEAERQALAMMDHPNIAKVLDAGATASGRPYFVMELVKGVPVTQYCDDNSLPTEERLKLFVQVCNAVQHAHQKGVIHRDLKPSNVMVTLHDGVPVPKVIDFGVSKALSQQLTEKTLFTRYGQIIGTPQYMSPEQAELSGLDVDTRSDIYSLGVLLYELLTGRPPFDSETLRKAGLDEMRRMIREDEPPPPSSRIRTLDADTATHVATHRGSRPERLSRLLRGELDWIVMKALEKNRNRRYETANGLALDITRHLTNEPVAAGPPSTAYQLFKIYQRHRRLFTLAGALAAGLLLGFIGSTVGFVWAVNERAAKEHALIAALDAGERERTSRAEAEAARKAAERALASQRESQRLLVELIAKIGTNLPANVLNDQTTAKLPPDVEIEMRASLAQKLMIMGKFKESAAHWRRALHLVTKGDEPGDRRRSSFLRYLGFTTGNMEFLEQTMQLERQYGELNYKTICLLGRHYLVTGQTDRAAPLLKQACEQYDPLYPPVTFMENPFCQRSRLLDMQGEQDQAVEYRELGLDVADRAYGGNIAAWRNAGKGSFASGDFEHAEWCYWLAKHMSDRDAKQPYEDFHSDMYFLFRKAGDITRSKQFAESGLAHNESDPKARSWWHTRQARCHVDVIDLPGAEINLRKALADAELAADDFQLQWCRFELGLVLRELGQADEANLLFDTVAKHLNERSKRHQYLWNAKYHRIVLIQCELLSTRNHPNLENLRSIATELNSIDAQDPYLHLALGLLCEAESRTMDALGEYRKFGLARDYQEQGWGEFAELRVIEILRQDGKGDVAIEFLLELIQKADNELKPIHPRRAISRQRLAEFLIEQKQEPERAVKLLEEARDNFKQHAIVPAKRFEEIDALIAQARALQAK